MTPAEIRPHSTTTISQKLNALLPFSNFPTARHSLPRIGEPQSHPKDVSQSVAFACRCDDPSLPLPFRLGIRRCRRGVRRVLPRKRPSLPRLLSEERHRSSLCEKRRRKTVDVLRQRSLRANCLKETNGGVYTVYGGIAYSRPCCTSWGKGRVDCFVRGPRSNVMHIRIEDGEYSEWQDLGFIIADEIECVNRDAGIIDIVVLDINHALLHNTLSDEVWSGWGSQGGTLMEVPSCAVRSSTTILCMARGTNNMGYYIGAVSMKWTKYYDMQGPLLHPIGCVARGSVNFNCFASGTNSHLYTKYYTGSWGGWQDLGGLVKGRPSVTTWNLSRIDVFSLDPRTNSVVQKTYHGEIWLEWVDLGGTFASNPECVTTGVNKIHCFAVGDESYLYKNDYESGWWSGWTSVKVKCIETPSCVVSNPNVASCYCRDFNQALMEMVFDYN